VDLDDILYGDDGIEYYLLYAYVGQVGILVLPRISCLLLAELKYNFELKINRILN
jgi:hypothetical protein